MVWLAILCPPVALLMLALRADRERKQESAPVHAGADMPFWRFLLWWLPVFTLLGWSVGHFVGWW